MKHHTCSRLLTRAAGLAGALALLMAAACSSQELYASGQGWQRLECNKLQDAQERNRCMASTSRSFEDFKREAESARNPK